MDRIILKSGRERSLLRKHPWIFSGAINAVEGTPQFGATMPIFSSKGKFLGSGAYNPQSSIRVRMWSFEERPIDKDYFNEQLRIAISFRENIPKLMQSTNAMRLVYGESDGLPGLIVDRYEQYLVLQILTAGMEAWRDVVAQKLIDLTGIGNIYERSDVDVRNLEGLEPKIGKIAGKEPPDLLEIIENGIRFLVDIKNGQKTGFFLDQRDNRAKIRVYAHNKKILNCFSYSGGFTIPALASGAEQVLSIDASVQALELGKKNLAINMLDGAEADWICGDVFQELRRLRDMDSRFDMIILDPPKFAPTIAQIQSAARGYKDINLLAFKLLKEGGHLITFSCSGGVNRDLFQKIVSDACLDAGVEAKVVEIMSQASDHPLALNFPESEYLKGLICQRL